MTSHDIFLKNISTLPARNLMKLLTTDTSEKVEKMFHNIFTNDVVKYNANFTDLKKIEDRKNLPNNLIKDEDHYGNLWLFLMERFQENIVKSEKLDTQEFTTFPVTTKFLDDFQFTPVVNYSFFDRDNIGFHNLEEIYDAYIDIFNTAIDNTNSEMKLTAFNTSLIADLFRKLFTKLATGITSNRDLSEYYFLNFQKERMFSDMEKNKLIAWILTWSYNKFNRQTVETESINFITKTIPIFDELYDDFNTNHYDSLNSSINTINLATSFIKNPEEKSYIFKNIERLNRGLNVLIENRTEDYINISNGFALYSIFTTMLANAAESSFDLSTLDNIHHCEYLLSLYDFFYKTEDKESEDYKNAEKIRGRLMLIYRDCDQLRKYYNLFRSKFIEKINTSYTGKFKF